LAAEVFADQLHLFEQDSIDGYDYRWRTMGRCVASCGWLSHTPCEMRLMMRSSASFQHKQQQLEKGDDMSSETPSKIVRFALSHPLPPPTPAQRAELDALA
jgi:hypothetical protein